MKELVTVKFPFEIRHGRAVMQSGIDVVKSRLVERLSWKKNQRVHTENVYCDVWKVRGMKNTPARQNLIDTYIKKSLQREPDIEVLGIDYENTDTKVVANIRFRTQGIDETVKIEYLL